MHVNLHFRVDQKVENKRVKSTKPQVPNQGQGQEWLPTISTCSENVDKS